MQTVVIRREQKRCLYILIFIWQKEENILKSATSDVDNEESTDSNNSVDSTPDVSQRQGVTDGDSFLSCSENKYIDNNFCHVQNRFVDVIERGRDGNITHLLIGHYCV